MKQVAVHEGLWPSTLPSQEQDGALVEAKLKAESTHKRTTAAQAPIRLEHRVSRIRHGCMEIDALMRDLRTELGGVHL